ncbi:DUF3124 domain-containing protein [Desulfobacter latus]|uniref:DUF3124 domain-containing protein n=1 Tax=Desulfobacter latus TaxID=2292 RepID=A0A850T366_9BACT|nr:DUF3124 domain-containing protein [Desulfobacter latus]NWH05541.1 DUF3124 domain-containing protein [Desulfobacter latus]
MRVKKYIVGYLVLLIGVLLCAAGSAFTQGNPNLSKGQTVYVPAYSHIYTGNRQIPSLLTVTLSIRNIDIAHTVKIISVNYYNTKGKLLKKYQPSPIFLNPLESIRYVVDYDDKTGGSGANFIVEWQSKDSMNPPIIESIMIGSRSSFTSRGQALIPLK